MYVCAIVAEADMKSQVTSKYLRCQVFFYLQKSWGSASAKAMADRPAHTPGSFL